MTTAGSDQCHETEAKEANAQEITDAGISHRFAYATSPPRLRSIVAERVGYADPTHFIRLFRRHHGATPAAWRQRERSSR